MLTVMMLAAPLLLQPVPGAQTAQTAPPEITLDFMAAGPDGQIVTDLEASHVTLKVDGKVRPLRSLELVSPAERGRTILLLVDEATLYGLEPVVKEAISKLVASLKPWDRLGYVSTRGGRVNRPSTKHEPTMAAVASMVTGPGVLHTCLSDLLRGIETVTRTLPQGRSTTLVVLSRGSSYDPSFGTGDAAGCTPRTEALRQVAGVISAAQINLHLLTVDEVNRSWGLDTLATNTGGLSGLVSWADAGALERAVAAPSAYYRATFAADDKAPPRPQRVDLRVDRPDVKVRTSPAVSIRPTGTSAPRGTGTS